MWKLLEIKYIGKCSITDICLLQISIKKRLSDICDLKPCLKAGLDELVNRMRLGIDRKGPPTPATFSFNMNLNWLCKSLQLGYINCVVYSDLIKSAPRRTVAVAGCLLSE